jgi:conjugal transfer mating pair stabilization protein TraG
MNSAIESVSQTMGWSHDQANAYVTARNAGIEVGTPAFFGASAKAGVNWSEDQRESFSSMTAQQKYALNQATQQYSEGATSMQRAGRTLDTKENRSDVEQYAYDFALNHQRTQTAAASVNKSNAEVDSLSHIRSRLESDSTVFSANVVPGFQKYLEGNLQNPQQIARLMNATTPDAMNDVRREFNDYASSEQFQRDFHSPVDTRTELEQLRDLHKPIDLNSPPALNEHQKASTEAFQEEAQHRIDIASEEARKLEQTGQLYEPEIYHNIRGNATLAGGQFQGDAQTTPPSALNPNSTVKTDVENNITPPKPDSKSDANEYSGHQLYNMNKNNKD